MPNWLFDPLTTAPSRFARNIADRIDDPRGEGGRLRGFLAGATEGVGDVLSDMTSPIGLAGLYSGGLGGVAKLGKLRKLRGERLYKSLPDEELTALYDRLGSEFVPVGGENIANLLRSSRMVDEASNIKQIANTGTDFISKQPVPVGGNIDIVELMNKLAKARGKQ